ncbi:MAG: hypothetical protein LBM77_01775 [Spirochaetaceae bacterium]|nr:hypothetical protein [Spirochaetaceae bacterium]
MNNCIFNCCDVILAKHILPESSPKSLIKLALVSESFPQNQDDYFDGKGEPAFIRNTNLIFNSLGYNYKTYTDYLNNGIYLTTAIKCVKKDYLVSSETIKHCSNILETELDSFANIKVIMLT